MTDRDSASPLRGCVLLGVPGGLGSPTALLGASSSLDRCVSPSLAWIAHLHPPTIQNGRYVANLPKRPKVPWTKLFPEAEPLALDVLERMLCFDPDKRITAVEALAHPYFRDYHFPADEPVALEPFSFEVEFDAVPLEECVQRPFLCLSGRQMLCDHNPLLGGLSHPCSVRSRLVVIVVTVRVFADYVL